MQDNFTDDVDILTNTEGPIEEHIDTNDESIEEQAKDMVNEESLDIYLLEVEYAEEQMDRYERMLSDLAFCSKLTTSLELTEANYQILTEQAGFVDMFGIESNNWHSRIQTKIAEVTEEAIALGPVGDAIRTISHSARVVRRKNAIAAKKKEEAAYNQKVANAMQIVEDHKKRNPPKPEPDKSSEKDKEYEVGKSTKKPRSRPNKTPKVDKKDVDDLEKKQEQAESSTEKANNGTSNGGGVIEVTEKDPKATNSASGSGSSTTTIVLVISAIVILGAVAILMWMRSFRYIRSKLNKIAGLEQPETIMNNNAPALVPPVIAKGALDFLKKNYSIVEGQFNDITKYPTDKVESLTRELNGYSARVKSSGGTLISKVFRNATPFAMGWKYEELVDTIDGVVDMVDKVTPLLTRPPARPIVIRQDATQKAVAKVQLKLSKKLVRAYLNLLRLLGRGVAQVAE